MKVDGRSDRTRAIASQIRDDLFPGLLDTSLRMDFLANQSCRYLKSLSDLYVFEFNLIYKTNIAAKRSVP